MKKKKIIIVIGILIVIVLIGCGVAIKINNDNKNKSIFEKEATTRIMYNIALYDEQAEFYCEFNYNENDIAIVIDGKDSYTNDNYYDGGISIDKKNKKVEMYGLSQLKPIEDDLIQAVSDISYVKKIIE